jgi:hypothetical protein
MPLAVLLAPGAGGGTEPAGPRGGGKRKPEWPTGASTQAGSHLGNQLESILKLCHCCGRGTSSCVVTAVPPSLLDASLQPGAVQDHWQARLRRMM